VRFKKQYKLNFMKPELVTFMSALTPFVEMKLAIPLGRELGLSITSTLIFAISGTIIPAAINLALIGPITKYLSKKSIRFRHFIEKIFKKTRHKHNEKFEKYGELFVLLFVAIPLPGSGAVSGSTLAFLFGLDYWKALTLIIIGTVIGAILLTAGIESVFTIGSLLH